MTITDNIGDGLSLDTDAAFESWPRRAQPIAPWWHTALLIALLVGVSLLGGIEAKGRGFGGGHIRRYLLTIGWEWALAALAWWGIRMRHVPLRQLLGERRSGWRMWVRDVAIALCFWAAAMFVLAALAVILRLLHLQPDQRSAVALAPSGGVEIALWFALCATAGMVEEFIFRGYLLQQFASLRWFGSAARSLTGGLWIGILVSSLLFGISHGYEGAGAMIAITAYGATFCILAVMRKSLRAGMMAHAWHDALAGITLALLRHLHAI